MNAPRDTDELINAFLDEGLTELPDRAFDAVRGEIHQHTTTGRHRPVEATQHVELRSRRVRRRRGRRVRARLGQLWPATGVGTGPTPSRPVDAHATPSGSARIRRSAVPACRGPLDPGDVLVQGRDVLAPPHDLHGAGRLGHRADGFIIKHAESPDEVFFAAFHVTHIFPDACIDDESTVVAAGTTPAELASLLAAQKSRVASATTDVTSSGLPAKRLELAVPADLEGTTCATAASGHGRTQDRI